MRSKYLFLGLLLVLIAPYVLSYGQTLEKTGHYVKRHEGGPWEWEPGLSILGMVVEFFGVIFLWSGVPLTILSLIIQSKPGPTSFTKMKKETIISAVALSCGYVAFVWSSQLKSESAVIFGVNVTTWFITLWGIAATIAGSISLVAILISGVRQHVNFAVNRLINSHGTRLIRISLEKISSNLTNRAGKFGYGPPSYSMTSLILNLLMFLTIVTVPGFTWFRWVAMFLFFWIYVRKGSSVGYQVLLEQVGKNATPVLATLGLLYGFVFSDPLSSAISNSAAVFFLFFSFNVPELILHRSKFLERLLFSSICGFLAFGGNLFMGSTLGILESLRNGGSYDALGGKLGDISILLILVVGGIVAAELFCDAPLLRARGVSSYAYEKASGSLFYLSFFFGFGGNKIISPLLFTISFGMLLIRWRLVSNPAREAWSSVRKLRLSLVEKFVDTSIDQRLITEGVLGSAVLAMLNFRFIGYVQIEPIQIFTIVLQSVPFLLFLYHKRRFSVIYTVSTLSVIITGLTGLFYIRSWPFCAVMTEVSTSLSGLFGSTGVGDVPVATFLSWVLFFYLYITLSEIIGIPIDGIRRRMEKVFKQYRRDELKKLYRLSLLVILIGSALFMLCSYFVLMRYHPSFAMLQQGELVHYDLFWFFLSLYTGGFVAKYVFSRYELYRPIYLVQDQFTTDTVS